MTDPSPDDVPMPRPEGLMEVSRDLTLDDDDRHALLTAISLAFRRPADTERLLTEIGFPARNMPDLSQADMTRVWTDVFIDLEQGILSSTPYRTILMAALRVYREHPVLRPMAERHGLVAPRHQAEPVLSHVIIQASSEEERWHGARVLDSLGLGPHEVWSTRNAVSFQVDADAPAVRAALDGSDLGWTVVAAGEPDYLYREIYVEGPDRRRFRVRDSPAQQTIRNLAADILESYYPRPAGSSLPIVVDHGDDEQQRVSPDSTLHDAGVRDGDNLRIGYQTQAGAGDRWWAGAVSKAMPEPEPIEPDRLRIRAEMDPEVGLGKSSVVVVTVSRESLGGVAAAGQALGSFSVVGDDALVIEAVPRVNLHVLGPDRISIPLPRRGRPQVVHFEARGSDLGPAELWIIARQGQATLKTLHLKVTVVAASGVDEAVVEVLSRQPASLQKLEVIEQRYGDGVRYRYHLDAPALGLLSAFESEMITGDRDDWVRSLFARIEGFWSDSNGDPERFAEELRSFGAELLDQLVPAELQRILWNNRRALTEVLVMSTEPFIPWELIHLKDPAAPRTLPAETCFLGELGLVRWDWGAPPPAALRVRAGRAYVIAPDYPTPPEPDGSSAAPRRLDAAETELDHLRRHFGAHDVEARHESVLALLRGDRFDLLHFVGHGSASVSDIGDAQLLLNGAADEHRYYAEPLRVSVVAQNFTSTSAPLVFLNACQAGRLGQQLTSIGGFATAFVGGGAGAFVSSLWSVGDSPAKEFAVAFYDALLADRTVSEAATAGRRAARQTGDATWLAYTVYADPRARLTFDPEPL